MIALISFNACQKENVSDKFVENIGVELSDQNGAIIEGEYIVVLHEGAVKKAGMLRGNYEANYALMKDELGTMVSKHNIQKENILSVYFNTIDGFALKADEATIEKLKLDPNVKSIEPNKIIALAKPVKPTPEPPAGQEIPWGIERVGGAGNGVGKTAWVIDSGIDLDHPDLNVDVARSKDFTGSRKGADDENGHGTHVAGTIGAIDNEIGVVGVAAGCNLVAVRVLDRRGSGSTTGVISGVDYVAANANSGDVANMSLGGGVSTALDDAVLAASSSCKFALAAGNESDNANNHSPARVNGPNIYTISAMDLNDNWAYFSNYGNPPVDYCAPGLNIYSTWKGGGYNTISGTSMASPHAAGVLLMGAAHTSGYVKGDPDGNADPIISQ